ncbi:MAG: hypothetical protein K6D94_03980 [Clostridiales bacterium]|nr:hypothetical protein [Clostridiales bacterium]
MKCEYCGSEIPAGAKKCPACEAPVPDKPASMVVKRGLVTPQIGKNAAKNTGNAGQLKNTPPQTANQTRNNPQPTYQSRPAYQTPPQDIPTRRADVQTAAKPKKSHKGLCVFLALIFFVELGVAAFKYPGFINKIRTVAASDNPYVKVIDVSSDSAERQLLRASSPGNPANLTIVPDAKKIAKIKPETAEVSPEDPVCSAGGITADFGKWNLDAEDTFEVRSLGTATDEANCCACVLYDLSLSSGIHEFPTAVTVTLPRTAGEFDGKIVHYNDELGVWEPTAFEVSDDGKSYSVRLYHFSLLLEAVFPVVNGKRGNVVNIFYTKGETKSAEGKSGFSHEATIRHLYGNHIYDLEYPMLQQLICLDETALQEYVYYQPGSDAQYVFDLIEQGKISEGFYNGRAFSAMGYILDKGGEITSFTGGSAGDAFTAIGLALTAYKLGRYFQDNFDKGTGGKGEKAVDATIKTLSDNWKEVSQALLSAGGLMVSPPTALAFALISLCYTYIPKGIQYIEDHTPRDYQDAVYRYYMNRRSGGVFDRDDLKLNGKGWPQYFESLVDYYKDDLSKVEPEVEKSLDIYINYFWDGLSEDQRKAVCEDCAGDLAYLYLFEPLSSQYASEIKAGWTEPAKAMPKEYKYVARDLLYQNTREAFQALAVKYLDQCEINLKNDIYNKLLPALNEFYIFYVRDDEYKSFADSPYANKKFYTSDGKYIFDKKKYLFSCPDEIPYSVSTDSPIRFCNEEGVDRAYYIRFKPANMMDYDFTRSYIPHANFGKISTLAKVYNVGLGLTEPENIIFVCRYYYYLMIGEPERIAMKNLKEGEEGAEDILYDITLKQSYVHTFGYNSYYNHQKDCMSSSPKSIRYSYLLVTPIDKEKKEEKNEKPVTYNMILLSDNSIDYDEPNEESKNSDRFEYTKYGADNTVTVTGKKCEVSLAAVNYVWLHKAAYQDDTISLYDIQTTFKRGTVNLTGTLSEEWENDDGKFKKFTFDSGPAVSGSWDILYLYNKKGLENGLHWHTTETRSYTESTNGYIQLQFNTKGDKLLRATISYLNNGVYTWDYHDSPIWEEMYDRTGTDKASAWSVVLSPEK